jgi:hypothetical protein
MGLTVTTVHMTWKLMRSLQLLAEFSGALGLSMRALKVTEHIRGRQ